MWDRAAFEALTSELPFHIAVDWDMRASALKYGHVNSLLMVLRALRAQGGTFADAAGDHVSGLEISPLKRKLTDQHRDHFSIVGHTTSSPILTAQVGRLHLDIYFNQHFYVLTETTVRQYFPSASVIVRASNFLKGALVPSPGSWGSDIIWLTHDWLGTFILEAMEGRLTGWVRRNFPGYKRVAARRRLVLSRHRPSLRERTLLGNNGFTSVIVSNSVEGFYPVLLRNLKSFIRTQELRLKGC